MSALGASQAFKATVYNATTSGDNLASTLKENQGKTDASSYASRGFAMGNFMTSGAAVFSSFFNKANAAFSYGQAGMEGYNAYQQGNDKKLGQSAVTVATTTVLLASAPWGMAAGGGYLVASKVAPEMTDMATSYIGKTTRSGIDMAKNFKVSEQTANNAYKFAL